MSAPQLPPHPGNRHQDTLELAFDGPIPRETWEAAREADARAAAEWAEQVARILAENQSELTARSAA